jgi:hypothetical protein
MPINNPKNVSSFYSFNNYFLYAYYVPISMAMNKEMIPYPMALLRQIGSIATSVDSKMK